jgi:hypothetical protein
VRTCLENILYTAKDDNDPETFLLRRVVPV